MNKQTKCDKKLNGKFICCKMQYDTMQFIKCSEVYLELFVAKKKNSHRSYLGQQADRIVVGAKS